MSTVFGPGTIDLQWSSVYGKPGLGATLELRGTLTARGYPPGAAAILFLEFHADDLSNGSNARIGTAYPVPVVLGYALDSCYATTRPPPADESTAQLEALVQMDSAVLEGFEDCRQGKDFTLQVDTDLLLVNLGTRPAPTPPVHFEVHPQSHNQQRLKVSRADWGVVLQQWGRGVGIPIVVSLPEATVDPERASIARFLKEAWQKIDGGDYQGAFVAARKSVELLRKMSPATIQIPRDPKDRDVDQRLSRIVQSLYDLASAELHGDGATKDYVPTREDAVALVGASAALAQCVFARMKS